MTPDGATLMAAHAGGVTPITVATGAKGANIAVADARSDRHHPRTARPPTSPRRPAVTPVDVAGGAPKPLVSVPGADGVAVTPDGRTAYVTGGSAVTPSRPPRTPPATPSP